MTTKQLREWMFTNNKEDQWWLSRDSVPENKAITITEIEEKLKSVRGGTFRALHVSQTSMANPPWIDIDLLTASPQQSPPVSVTPPTETLGMIALLLPLVGALLSLGWVGNMNLLQGPNTALNLIMVLVIVGSALLIGVEASRLGIGGPADPRVIAGNRVTGAIGWAAFTMLLWVVGFPAYMHFRSKFGLRNMLVGSIAVTVFFLGCVMVISSAIDNKAAEIILRRGFFDK